jgi:hypothetical protein
MLELEANKIESYKGKLGIGQNFLTRGGQRYRKPKDERGAN